MIDPSEVNHDDFQRVSLARFQTIAFGRRLGYPAIDALNALGRRVRIAGEREWLAFGFVSLPSRRDAWLRLMEIECARVHGDEPK